VQVTRVDTSADDTVQFTPLSGGNESNIDDGNTPDDDTSYNSSSTVNHKDLFSVSGYSLPAGTNTIVGVALHVVTKVDSGARTLRPVIKSSTTTSNGTATVLSTSYGELSMIASVDPHTSAAWADATAINAMKIGYEITA
jgi:hypothetical protein